MSEFRQDLVSGDWIIMAPERAKRPHDLIPKKPKRKPTPKSACPFEHPEKTGNWPPILSYPNEKQWEAILIENKFPALRHVRVCSPTFRNGPYQFTGGIGHHDLLITRDHTKHFGDLPLQQVSRTLEMLQKRYHMLAKDRCLLYTSTFFNWGPTAGASLFHPHYQVLTLPIIPPEVEHSLNGSARYFKRTGKCAHCVSLTFEKKWKRRVLKENGLAIAVAPYAPQQPFEIRIYPKRHLPCFERTPASTVRGVAELLQFALRAMRAKLNDPDLNFFIHTSPLKRQNRYGHYHWHIEILPKVSIPAGFELSTGVIINAVEPHRAVEILLGKK
jgi:UDPglucose--hexose-1-phosphate uridylyltransferase